MTERLPDEFTLWGHKLSKDPGSSEYYTVWRTAEVWPNGNPDIQVGTIPTIEKPGHPWSISIHWPDRTLCTGFGETFAEAKRNLANLLSERSREVGHVG